MRICFLWEEITNARHRLTDGLGEALKELKNRGHVIGYFEPEDDASIFGFKPDVVLYWGPLCARTKEQVTTLPFKKAIAFGGGAIEDTNVDGFDLYFTESKVNEDELTAFGKPWMRAFGINEKIFRPLPLEKKFDGFSAATFALWKRPELFAQALGGKGCWTGIKQEHEKECYEVCEKHGVEIHDELPREQVNELMNQSNAVVNTSSLWGGGQRLTLEAMACNLPVIVMDDSPKNMEYVEESGFGLIVPPEPLAIQEAILKVKGQTFNSRDYIKSKFTIKAYADALEKGLTNL